MSNALDDLRQKLADVVCSDRAVDNWQATPSDYDLADAIIAALPGLVVSLKWRKWGGGSGETTTAPVLSHTYSTARSVTNEGMWRLRGPWPKHTYHPTKEAAKAAAQAHYTAQIMAAFGIDAAAMKEGKDA